MKYLRFLVLTILILGLASCSQDKPVSEASPEIDRIGWTFGNLPSDYWKDGSGPSAVIDFTPFFKDTSIQLNDIKNVTIINSLNSGNSWSFEGSTLNDNFFTNSKTGESYLEFNGLWTSSITGNGSVIYLGTYTITVELNNGKRETKTLTPPAPNSLNANGFSYIYSPESYAGTPPSNYVSLTKQATIQSATLNATGTTLEIQFSVADEKVYSGWVLLYNQEGEFIGSAGDFRNFSRRTLHPKLNSGSIFHIDGSANTFSVAKDDISKSTKISDFNLTDISIFRIILTDGKQYEGTDSFFDTYSISALSTVTK
jgi:hypothetical protein